MKGVGIRALQVAGTYAIFGVFWILLSDSLLMWITGESTLLTQLQSLKGLAYVGLTALLVFFMTRHVLHSQIGSSRAVVDSERRFSDMFEQAAVGIALLSPAGKWLRVNPKLQEFLGYSSEEFHERSYRDFVWPEDMAESDLSAMQLRMGSIHSFQIENRFVTKSGKAAWGRVSVSATRCRDGALEFFIAIIEDIGPRKHAEAEREVLMAQFLQAQKMEAVGRLAGGVAHDFNNMLGVIVGYTEMVMLELGQDHPQQGDLEEVLRAARRSTALTRQLLAFARKETISPRALDLNKHIEESVKLLGRILGEQIRLIYLPGESIWPVYMDPTQLDQILANLAVNSHDAITADGSVEIRTANTHLKQGEIPGLTEHEAGDFVCLSFADSGCGMSAEVLEHMFEPFFTTKAAGKGTGLGLATVYGIVQQNHGQIVATSEPGGGTAFSIYLPRHHGTPTDSGRRMTKPTAGHETIFLVEDEPQLVELFQRSLEKSGFKVHAFCDPLAAVRAAAAATHIDLLVTDVMMPGMTGVAVNKGIQALWPNTPILFISGHSENVLLTQGLIPEGIHYIQKPFSPAQLAERVREILDARQPGSKAPVTPTGPAAPRA